MSRARVFFLTLSFAAAAWAQDPPLTGTLKVGTINLGRINIKFSAGPLGTIESTQDTLAGAFSSIDLSKSTRTDPPEVTTIGSCFIQALGQSQDNTESRSSFSTALDAGPVLNITGPNGSNQFAVTKTTIAGQTLIGYAGQLGGGTPIPGLPAPAPLYLSPGTYTADNGAGGPDVGAFTATLTLPDPFVWTNVDASLSIDRAAGLDIIWTGGDPESKVFIAGTVSLTNPATRRVEGGKYFSCSEKNSAGHFVLPPELLTLLPATTVTNGVSNGSIIVSNGVEAKFDLPGFDQSTFTFSSAISRNVEFK